LPFQFLQYCLYGLVKHPLPVRRPCNCVRGGGKHKLSQEFSIRRQMIYSASITRRNPRPRHTKAYLDVQLQWRAHPHESTERGFYSGAHAASLFTTATPPTANPKPPLSGQRRVHAKPTSTIDTTVCTLSHITIGRVTLSTSSVVTFCALPNRQSAAGSGTVDRLMQEL
jgi:hypothetical protein